jgi:hypothetical protein
MLLAYLTFLFGVASPGPSVLAGMFGYAGLCMLLSTSSTAR